MKSQRLVSLAPMLKLMSRRSERYDEVDEIESKLFLVKTKNCQVPENRKNRLSPKESDFAKSKRVNFAGANFPKRIFFTPCIGQKA